MKKIISPLKFGIISGFTFFGTVAILSLVYAAIGTSWTSPSTIEAGAGSGLTASSWNAILANLNNLDARSVPTWSVIAFNLTTCPNGWSPADGGWSPARPDLRGEFIRGLDNGRGVDSGRTIRSWQAQDWKSFDLASSHTYYWHGAYIWKDTGNFQGAVFWGKWEAVWDGVWNVANSLSIKWDTSEIRPRNVALLYCIKN